MDGKGPSCSFTCGASGAVEHWANSGTSTIGLLQKPLEVSDCGFMKIAEFCKVGCGGNLNCFALFCVSFCYLTGKSCAAVTAVTLPGAPWPERQGSNLLRQLRQVWQRGCVAELWQHDNWWRCRAREAKPRSFQL